MIQIDTNGGHKRHNRPRETNSAQERLNLIKADLEGRLEELKLALTELKLKAREEYMGSRRENDYFEGLERYAKRLKTSFEHKNVARSN